MKLDFTEKKKKKTYANFSRFYNNLLCFRKQFACRVIHICSATNCVSQLTPSVYIDPPEHRQWSLLSPVLNAIEGADGGMQRQYTLFVCQNQTKKSKGVVKNRMSKIR